MTAIDRFQAIFGWLLFLSLSSACSQDEFVQRQNYGRAQGSTYQVSYISSPGIDHQSSIDSLFLAVDMSLSAWEPQSSISRLNRGDTLFQRDDLLWAVMDSASLLWKDSEGLFDISMGAVIHCWGFHRKTNAVPTDSALDRAMASSGSDKIHRREDSLWLSEGAQLDVNGIAQGYTVDLIAQLLESRGVRHYMVEVGGELRCKGRNIDDKVWSIGIDKPTDKQLEDRLQRVLPLKDRALATSGNYRKYITDPTTGRRYGHSIDPRTGRSTKDRLLSATVIAGSATKADAWGTALMVGGFKRAREWVQEHPELEAYLIYTDKKGEWAEWFSPGFPR